MNWVVNDYREARDESAPVNRVLDAIDHLLDTMEGLEAPITRELLANAMIALVHECGLSRGVWPLH